MEVHIGGQPDRAALGLVVQASLRREDEVSHGHRAAPCQYAAPGYTEPRRLPAALAARHATLPQSWLEVSTTGYST